MTPMKEKLLFRQDNTVDIQQLKELGLLAYGQYAGQLGEDGWEKMRTGIGRDATWESLLLVSKCFVCVDNDVLAGMGFLVPNGNPWDVFPAEWCYIRMLGVRPGYEGRGIAGALTKMCMDEARKNGESTIALHTSELMHAARHIYEREGFKIEREIPVRYGVRYWLYSLKLLD